MLVSHARVYCKYRRSLPTLFYPTREPAVTAFYYGHDIEFDLATYEHRTRLLEYEQEPLSEDPLRIRITIPLGVDALELTYDDHMDLVGLRRDA